MPSPLDRICVSTWSFHTLFEQSGIIDTLDFPKMVADRYHVHNVEIVYPHFASTEPSYLDEFKNRLRRAHSRVVNIPIDFAELWEKPALSSPDPVEREHAIALYEKGIDLAAALDCPTGRCDPGTVNLHDPSLTVDSYKTLAAYGKLKGVGIVVENHGSIARHPEVLAKILQDSGAAALPDIGNFPDEETRERGLRLLFPLAKGIAHAKLAPHFDLAKYVRIANGAGFKGVFSIEATDRGDPYEAVQQILDALVSAL